MGSAMEEELVRLRQENKLLREALQSSMQGVSLDPLHDAAPIFERTFEAPHDLTKEQVERYSRQVLLDSFGVQAQSKLSSGSVLVVGCGGLGSPVALYLAAAGVGRLGLVDKDAVELSNLHRQICHSEARVGMHKATSAAVACGALNALVRIETHLDGLTPGNAVDLVSRYDVVVDASDNAPTRYLISDACVVTGRPLVSAAAIGTDGQLTVYCSGPDVPCYRCLYPESPAPENCSKCSEAGVLGVVPGIMGTLQALEAIKLLSGVGQPLARRLLLLDGLSGRIATIKLRARVAGCAACGTDPVITRGSLKDYNYREFTGQTADDGPPPRLRLLPDTQRLSPQQLRDALQPPSEAGATAPPPLILDVRPASQFAVMRLPGAVNVPFDKFESRASEVVAMCNSRQPNDAGAAAAALASAVAECSGSYNAAPSAHESVPNNVEEHSGSGVTGTPAAAPTAAQPSPSGCETCNGTHGLVTEDGQGGRHSHMPEDRGFTTPNGMGGSSSNSSSSCGRSVFVVCRRGNDSQRAVHRLQQLGVAGAVDLVGGMQAWAKDLDPHMPDL